jgi:malonyl CoA-acyl carrier protein transacylase
MGRDVAERFPAARLVFQAIDDALGVPLSRIMFEGPEDELTFTQNAQPAILAHSVAVTPSSTARWITVARRDTRSVSTRRTFTAGAPSPTEAASPCGVAASR